MEDFVIRSLVAGIGIAIIAGGLGCFVVWRKMAYFGDSLAHSSLLGVALGLLVGINPNIGVILICSLFAVLLTWLQQKRILAIDTLLGIMAHGGLSIGLVCFSFLRNTQFSQTNYLIGDILSVTNYDLIGIYVGVFVVGLCLILNWSSLTLMTIHEDLAKAEGVNTFNMQVVLMFMMTIVVAVSIQFVGVLLITSMLIVPAATARQLSRSPEAMAITSCLIGVVSVILGLFSSLHYDTPSGPSIVAASVILFAVLSPIAELLKRR